MYEILPLREDLQAYLKRYRIKKKWEKAKFFLQENTNYPGLNVELLEPKHQKTYSFRLDKKFRGIFIFQKPNLVEIIAFTKHYQ